jgi:hypothetical protein
MGSCNTFKGYSNEKTWAFKTFPVVNHLWLGTARLFTGYSSAEDAALDRVLQLQGKTLLLRVLA